VIYGNLIFKNGGIYILYLYYARRQGLEKNQMFNSIPTSHIIFICIVIVRITIEKNCLRTAEEIEK